MSKTISFAIPCYNSAAYMDHCIQSILDIAEGADDIEILIVNDGSTKDNTAKKADEWEAQYPGIIKAIHKPNGGHGSAVNSGIANAAGKYYKVVDSDDWVDLEAGKEILSYLRTQMDSDDPVDLVLSNYVYEKVHENTQTVVRYTNVFPEGREFGWQDTHSFRKSQYILMHSVIYRTQMLRDCGLKLPEHCFYVDNVFVYVPLPYVKKMRYFNVDFYRYFIGREDQSVNEKVMYSRRAQQLKVTRTMIDSVTLPDDCADQPKLEKYMENYLGMMMCICTVFLRMESTPENKADLASIWNYLDEADSALCRRLRMNIVNFATNLPGEAGRKIGMGGYHIAQKLFSFN